MKVILTNMTMVYKDDHSFLVQNRLKKIGRELIFQVAISKKERAKKNLRVEK
jgi:hypothetical protein